MLSFLYSENILISSMQSVNNINLGSNYHSYNTSSISSNIVVNNNININAINGSFTIEAGKDEKETHSVTTSSGFMSSSTTTSDTYSLHHNASNITSLNGNINIQANNNINILGSNISSLAGDISLTTIEGDVNVIALVDKESSFYESSTTSSIGSVNLSASGNSTLNQSTSLASSNLIASNININSGNSANILASNLTSQQDININAENNISILAGIETTLNQTSSWDSSFSVSGSASLSHLNASVSTTLTIDKNTTTSQRY